MTYFEDLEKFILNMFDGKIGEALPGDEFGKFEKQLTKDEVNVKEQSDFLHELFPRADKEFLKRKSKFFSKTKDEKLFKWLEDSLERKGKDFPKAASLDRKREVQISSNPFCFSDNWIHNIFHSVFQSLETIKKIKFRFTPSFRDEWPDEDPVEFYKATREVSEDYSRTCIFILKEEFRELPVFRIKRALKSCGYRFNPAFKSLKEMVEAVSLHHGPSITRRKRRMRDVPATLDAACITVRV